MRCLYCGKKLSLLKLAKGDSFCSSEHFDAHQLQLSKSAFDRLLSVSGNETEKPPLVFSPTPPATQPEPEVFPPFESLFEAVPATEPAPRAETEPPVRPRGKTQREVKALEDFQPPPEQRKVATQSKAAPLGPKEAKAARRNAVAQKSQKLIPAAPPADEPSNTAPLITAPLITAEDAMARLRAFDGPPQAPFASQQLAPFPPAAEAPLGVVAPSLSSEEKHELAYPVHSGEVTACILNLYLTLTQTRFRPVNCPAPAALDVTPEPFPTQPSRPAVAFLPEFPEYEFDESTIGEPAELALPVEAPPPLAPAVPAIAAPIAPTFTPPLANVDSCAHLESSPAIHGVEQQSVIEPTVAELAAPVEAPLQLAPAVPATAPQRSFGPEASTPAKPVMPLGPEPENPLPAPDTRVKYLVAPSFKERIGGESRIQPATDWAASMRAPAPVLPSGWDAIPCREISLESNFLKTAALKPLSAGAAPVSGRAEFPQTASPHFPSANALARPLHGWHQSPHAVRLSSNPRDARLPQAKAVGFLPAVANFSIRPSFRGRVPALFLGSQSAVSRPAAPSPGGLASIAAPSVEPSRPFETEWTAPRAARPVQPAIGQTPLRPFSPAAAQGSTPLSNSFSAVPSQANYPPALASRRAWLRLSAEGWNASVIPPSPSTAGPWMAEESPSLLSRQEPEPAEPFTRLTSALSLETHSGIQKGAWIDAGQRAPFTPPSENLVFWPEALSRLAAALPECVAAKPPAASVNLCTAYTKWEAKPAPASLPAIPKFLPTRGGAALPAAAEWPRLGAPPR